MMAQVMHWDGSLCVPCGQCTKFMKASLTGASIMLNAYHVGVSEKHIEIYVVLALNLLLL